MYMLHVHWSKHTFERSFHESEGQFIEFVSKTNLLNYHFWALFFRVRGPIHGARRCGAAWSNHNYERSFPKWLVRNLRDRDRVFVSLLAILKGAPLWGHLATQIYAVYFWCSHAFCCWLPHWGSTRLAGHSKGVFGETTPFSSRICHIFSMLQWALTTCAVLFL